MAKVDLKKSSVAYYDSDEFGVEPGFYIVEGKPVVETSVGYKGEQIYVTEVDEEGEEYETVALDERGRPLVDPSSIQPDFEHEVSHDSNCKPGTRVWPSSDGEGFVTENPEGGEDDG